MLTHPNHRSTKTVPHPLTTNNHIQNRTHHGSLSIQTQRSLAIPTPWSSTLVCWNHGSLCLAHQMWTTYRTSPASQTHSTLNLNATASASHNGNNITISPSTKFSPTLLKYPASSIQDHSRVSSLGSRTHEPSSYNSYENTTAQTSTNTTLFTTLYLAHTYSNPSYGQHTPSWVSTGKTNRPPVMTP